MTDAPLTEAERAAVLTLYAIHDRIWSQRDDLHGELYWEDAQLIGNDLAKDYITVAESDRRVQAAKSDALEAAREYVLNASRAAAAAQREHDDDEGIEPIGTSTAAETEWYQLGNWARSAIDTFRLLPVTAQPSPLAIEAAPEPKHR